MFPLVKINICVFSKSGQSLTKMACDNTQKSSMLLVRKLYMLMQNLGPLPDDVCLNMKLFYYDEGKSTLAATDCTMHMKCIVCLLFPSGQCWPVITFDLAISYPWSIS